MRHNHDMKKIIQDTKSTDKKLDALLPKVRDRILQALGNGETEHARRQLVILEKIAKISRLIGTIQTPYDYQSQREQRDALMKELEERFQRISENNSE